MYPYPRLNCAPQGDDLPKAAQGSSLDPFRAMQGIRRQKSQERCMERSDWLPRFQNKPTPAQRRRVFGGTTGCQYRKTLRYAAQHSLDRARAAGRDSHPPTTGVCVGRCVRRQPVDTMILCSCAALEEGGGGCALRARGRSNWMMASTFVDRFTTLGETSRRPGCRTWALTFSLGVWAPVKPGEVMPDMMHHPSIAAPDCTHGNTHPCYSLPIAPAAQQVVIQGSVHDRSNGLACWFCSDRQILHSPNHPAALTPLAPAPVLIHN